MELEVIIFYILLIDAVGANLMAWTSRAKWYQKHFRILSRWFPAARGWTTYYLLLVMLFGLYLKSQSLI